MEQAAVILAAGQSERMGRPKAFLEGSTGTTFFEECLAAIDRPVIGRRIAVVSEDVFGDLPEYDALSSVMINLEPEHGQISSLRLALQTLKAHVEFGGAYVLLVDNPGHLPERMEALMAAVTGSPEKVLAAAFDGQAGHPIWLPQRLWSDLIAYTGEGGLRGFLDGAGEIIEPVETGQSDSLTDVDTPEDYEAWRESQVTGDQPPEQ